MASSSSTPSSTITLPKKYHVFLSFRAPDTHVGFTSHLYDALSRKYMVTFIDYKLVRGDEISPALLKSIQESKIAVIIFSKDYASSKWCLRELAEIVKCKKLNELIVLPIFYYVDPSDVLKQTGPFKDSFDKHENESQDEVQEWREAFTEASNLPGWDYAGIRSEFELIHDIVEDVQSKLMSEIENISPPLNDDFECLIGIDKRIQQVMSLLCFDTMDVRIIGIWGMGGIGKTTLAAAVFNRIYGQFDGSCFIEKVGERLEEPGALDSLVHEILSKLLDEQNLKLATPAIRNPFIKERLNRKKVLIVLDDVNNFLQLETLVEVLNGSGLGSRMVMTSRDKQVLDNFVDNHDHIYEVDGLDHDEALELFCEYAFKKKHPTEGFMNLSVWMVSYTKGNPLALKVLGSHLLRRNKQEWESAFDDLQGIGDSDIFTVLKISYDGLNDKEKNLFLNIACFFNGYFEDNFAKLLDYDCSLRVLINKSLITTEEGRIKMHDLPKEMGREIVRRESQKNPGKSSRLWKLDDAILTPKNNSYKTTQQLGPSRSNNNRQQMGCWLGSKYDLADEEAPTNKPDLMEEDVRSASTISNIEKEHMFDKVVTPSDVGKLNRLVIPKQHAEKFFPLDSSANEKGLLLNFEDRNGKPWRFRYSYWNSSQSYVMTKGWSRFVKDKKLDAGDIVSFQRGVGDLARDRLYIDWRRRPDAPEPSSFPLQHHLSFHRSIPWSPMLMRPPPAPVMTRDHLHMSQMNHFLNRNGYYDGGGGGGDGGYGYGSGSNNVMNPCHMGSVFYLRSQPLQSQPLQEQMGMSMGEWQSHHHQYQHQQQQENTMVFDSVPVVQGKAAAKRLRLFGVNMDCPISETSTTTDDDECGIVLSSTTLQHAPIMPTIQHHNHHHQLSSSHSQAAAPLQLRLYNGTSMPPPIDFLNKGKASMS